MKHVWLLFLFAACQAGTSPNATCDADEPVNIEVSGLSIRVDAGPCGAVTWTARVVGDDDVDVSFAVRDGVLVPTLQGRGRPTALALSGQVEVAGDSPLTWWRQGYQSWSFSGVVEVASAPALARDGNGLPRLAGDGDAFSVTDEISNTSWWAASMGRDQGASILVGALTSEVSRNYLAIEDDSLTVVWAWPEGLKVDGSRDLEPLWIGASPDAVALWSSYGAAVAKARGVAKPNPGPRGWGSWNIYYADVTEADVRAQAEVLADAGWIGAVVEIDDGWETRWGDWSANARFPSNMAVLASDISSQGLVPGIWMAPIYVDRATSTYAAHPDWWVRTLDGAEEIVFTNSGSGDYAVLDTTVPEARAWMVDQVAQKAADGYRFFKLDFLYAAAQVGQRHRDITGIAAYHDAMAALREATRGAVFLACGAPLLPSVGYVDAYRTGADIAFALIPDPSVNFIRWQARQTASRGVMASSSWINDPDVVLVREPLTQAGRRLSLVTSLLAGGSWLLGDDLTALEPTLLAQLMRDDLASLRQAVWMPRAPLQSVSTLTASPLGIGTGSMVPPLWDGPAGAVAIVNVEASPRTLTVPAGRGALTSKRYEAGAYTLGPGDADIILPDGGSVDD